ncbi:peptide ABC transporter substrate-binding protein [Sedimentibacter sp. MB31-C6]|uniref:peptide ABC transporter substrate-binding protein n=1 Tax=Sedimentibacter sp. MB31-C6 TaxID=3109366 RepID=UPI002DDCFE31|nr:peptide ABC transporter substrate-binding protein [Sedimentibacter sp. MB36-C1]WSI04080.1 peptide ABC transporter substrate-binding protein [Sedimentibacter sp. MB36-C1]
MKLRKTLLLTMVMIFLLTSCTTPGQSDNVAPIDEEEVTTDVNESETTEKKILRYSLIADAPTLDPQLMNSIPSSTVGFHIYEGLMRNHVGEIQPGMAKDYEISEDGKIYTFYLRDAQWSDGVEIKAQDYEYALRRLVDPETASDYSFLVTSLIKNAGDINAGNMPVEELGVNAIDEKTLTIELNNPTGYFLSMLSMSQLCPVRQDIVEQYGKDFSADAEKNVYSGPFIVKDWKHEDRIILEKNPNYWNAEAIKLDEVHILTVADPMTAVAMFEQGELDQVNIPAEVLANYEDKVEYYFDGANDFIKLNMDGSSELSNKDLRLAINYSLNREDYILLTTQNMYLPNTRYVLPQVNGVNGEYGEEYPYEAFPVKGDIDLAKEHLSKAMIELGATNPSDIEVELLTTDQERTRIEAEVLQNQIQTALGIKVNIRQVPYKQRLQMESDHEFEMVVTGWVPDYPDPMSYLELWPTDSPYNHGSYSSEIYDGYIKEALSNTNPQERMDALFNAEKTLLEDGAIVPLQLRRNAMLVNPKVKGFETYFVGINYDYIYADIEE